MPKPVLQTIHVNDLARGTRDLRPDLDAAIARVLDRGYFVLGPENDALEAELSGFLGLTTDGVLVGNGTDALQLALAALGTGPSDLVVTVANAGGYTTTAARSLGAELLYTDVEPETLQMSADTFGSALERADRTPKAVVVTHLFGTPADVSAIVDSARAAGIAIVEDCAQALGGEIGGQRLGTFGDLGTTSFYPTKNLGAVGDAGAVFGSDPGLLARARQLRQYGWKTKYRVALPGGMNSRMDEIQAAVIRAKLPHLDAWNGRRREIHAQFEAAAGPAARFVTGSAPGSTGHLAVLEVADRARAQELFREAGVGTDVHYPVPDHRQEAFARDDAPLLPVTESAAEHILSIPLFPELREDEIARICAVLSAL